jgi:hypothetical protein
MQGSWKTPGLILFLSVHVATSSKPTTAFYSKKNKSRSKNRGWQAKIFATSLLNETVSQDCGVCHRRALKRVAVCALTVLSEEHIMIKAASQKVAEGTLISSDAGRFVRRHILGSLAMTVCFGLPVVVYFLVWNNSGSEHTASTLMMSVDNTHPRFADNAKNRCIPRKPCPEKDKAQP